MNSTTSILKALRRRGLAQMDIRRRTGIPQSRLSKWEGGQVPAAADDALKLQALLSSLEAEDRGGEVHAGSVAAPLQIVTGNESGQLPPACEAGDAP